MPVSVDFHGLGEKLRRVVWLILQGGLSKARSKSILDLQSLCRNFIVFERVVLHIA